MDIKQNLNEFWYGIKTVGGSINLFMAIYFTLSFSATLIDLMTSYSPIFSHAGTPIPIMVTTLVLFPIAIPLVIREIIQKGRPYSQHQH